MPSNGTRETNGEPPALLIYQWKTARARELQQLVDRGLFLRTDLEGVCVSDASQWRRIYRVQRQDVGLLRLKGIF